MDRSFVDRIKTNRWAAFGLLALAALFTIAYIDNVIKVNKLMVEVQQLEHQNEEIRTSNELLNAKLIELQSAERITKIAEEKLGMIKPSKAPIKLEHREND